MTSEAIQLTDFKRQVKQELGAIRRDLLELLVELQRYEGEGRAQA
jgi:hypothetical protein